MSYTTLILCLVLVALPNLSLGEESTFTQYTFEQFEKQFGRNYQGQQRQQHRKAFNKNYQELLALQRKNGGNFQVRVNNFTDMTEQEKKNFLNYKPLDQNIPVDSLPKPNRLRSIALPQEFNYANQGKVTSVKNQGKCGACWAYTAVGMYQSQLLIHGVGQYDLSEQYVLQCTDGGSCNGGWPVQALNVIQDKGIPSQHSYPYKAKFDAYNKETICSTQSQNFVKLPLEIESIKHYNMMPDGQLKQTLLDKGPVSVGVRGIDTGFLYYAGGVFSGCPQQIGENEIDHVVMLVGWTKQGNWIIKNSWGKSWGQNGYGIIDKTRNCGITNFVDVLDVKQLPIKNKDGEITAAANQLQDVKITLTDSFGDGWNGYIMGIRQKNKIMTVFGQEFKSGSQQGPIQIQLKSGVQAQIVVSVVGRNSQQIGFSITDSQGKQLCTRKPGSTFSNDIIFCVICPNCESSNTVSYQLTLTDLEHNGWNENVLAFKQNGVITTFGQQFVSGQKYGPRKVQFSRNYPVQIVVDKVGRRSQDIGFQLRDSFGNIVFSKKPGSSFSPDSKLGQFCPGCQNLFPVNSNLQGQVRQQQTTVMEGRTDFRFAFILVTSILSAIIVILMGILLYCVVKKTKQLSSNSFTTKDFKGVSILGSTATIPDESPQQQNKQNYSGQNNTFSRDQRTRHNSGQYKIN